MILVGIGANLSGIAGEPLSACNAAVSVIISSGITVIHRSRWIESSPVPLSTQPWFVNGVALIDTELEPRTLLDFFHQVEIIFGRTRSRPNAPRVLDLDLLAYHQLVNDASPILPHPRLHERAFVLLPLLEIAPYWYHPKKKKTVLQMVTTLPSDQKLRWI